jgi:hypothetical protein
MQPPPAGITKIYPRDTKVWPDLVAKPGVRLNTHLRKHTDELERNGLHLPKMHQTVTPHGGYMGNAKQRWNTIPSATMDALSRGEVRGQWWARDKL